MVPAVFVFYDKDKKRLILFIKHLHAAHDIEQCGITIVFLEISGFRLRRGRHPIIFSALAIFIVLVYSRVKPKRNGREKLSLLNADLVKSAKRSVAFIDPFATIEVLKFAAMRAKGVQAVVYSARITPEFRAAADLHKKQYPGLDLKTMRTIHDRFLLVDDKVYHFGASFKDMGNEMTAFSVLDFVTPAEVIEKIQESMKGR